MIHDESRSRSIRWSVLVRVVLVGVLAAGTGGRADDRTAPPAKSDGDPPRPDLYFPPPESQGGWRKLDDPDAIRRIAGMDPDKLEELRGWLRRSDRRRLRGGRHPPRLHRAGRGTRQQRGDHRNPRGLVLQGDLRHGPGHRLGAKPTRRDAEADDLRRQGVRLHPLGPAAERPAQGESPSSNSSTTPRASARKRPAPPTTGPGNTSWATRGDRRTAKLAFDPGTACGYSTHALAHAALVCETVTGKPYDEFAIEALFKPLGIEHWWFQYYEGGPKIGRHPSHGLGMPARDMARIAYCMAHDGRWNDRQVIPEWFVEQTAAPTHDVNGPEMRFKINAQIFSHGWELPARLTGEGGRSGRGIPPTPAPSPAPGAS